MNELSLMQRIVVWLLPIVFAITVHEVAHGWVAKKFGDNTAYLQGRLTLNPMKHIDWIGTVIIPCLLLISSTGFIFGWAKPVPVDVRNFAKPRAAMSYVAIAGPMANLLMAFGWVLLARIGVMINIEFISLPLIYSGIAGITINLVLLLINMIPIPPLDGSRVLAGLLPARLAWYFNKLEPYGFFILLALLMSGALAKILGYPLFYAQQFFFNLVGI